MYFLSCSLGQSVAPSADVSNQSNFIDRMKATVSRYIMCIYITVDVQRFEMYICIHVELLNIVIFAHMSRYMYVRVYVRRTKYIYILQRMGF